MEASVHIILDTSSSRSIQKHSWALKHSRKHILRDLRGSEKAPGQERIYTAGEKEYDVWMYRKDKGVPVTEAVQKEFIGLRDEFGLTQFKFPFEK